MPNATLFTHPKADWQRRYEALRASFVARLPAAAVADRFSYKPGCVRLLRHLFSTGKFDFNEPPEQGKTAHRRVIGLTIKGAAVPAKVQAITIGSLDGKDFESDTAGIFLFAPFVAQLGLGPGK